MGDALFFIMYPKVNLVKWGTDADYYAFGYGLRFYVVPILYVADRKGMEKMKKSFLEKKILLTLLLSSSVFVGGTCAFAEEPVENFTLGEFVVTASRVATNKADTPANISVITKENIADNNYSDAAEAISKVPGVNVLGSGAKGTSMGQDKILINGDERVLVLIDGRRVNLGSSGNYSADWLPPVNAIERIEVLKGAGSALYGTDAVGGVINIITKKGSELESSVTVRAAAGSWNTEQYGITAGGATKNGLGIFVSASKDRRGNYSYKDIDGDVKKMPNSGFNTEGVNLKLDQQLGKDNRITMQFEHLNTEGGSPFGYYGIANTDKHKRLNNNISMRYDWEESTDNSGYMQIYRNHHHAQFLSDDIVNRSDFTESTLGLDIQQNFKLNKSNALTAGLSYYRTKVNNDVMFDGEKEIINKAIFVEDRWQFAENWNLNTGLRLDNHNEYGSELTPRIALNKKFNEDSNMYLSWGRVFNAPTAQDLYWKQYDSVYNSWTLGNPDLKPEKGNVWTLGINSRVNENTNVAASIFYSELKDAIDWDYSPIDNSSNAININKEKRKGLELNIDHNFDEHLSAYASYTYIKVKQDYGNGYLNNGSVKPNIYRAGMKYKNNEWLFDMTLTAATGLVDSYIGKYGVTKAFTDKSYLTLDLGVQYKINKAAKVFVKGYNLTNARYQDYGGCYSDEKAKYPMPSRSFIVGMEYNF